eukprot:2549460-Rhodomonas_salina.4
MSDTAIGSVQYCLRICCYAMPGADIAYSASRWRGLNSAQRVGEGLNSVVLVAEVRGNGLADFGRTLEPLACSTGKRVGEKGLGNRVHDASSPCSGAQPLNSLRALCAI